jgi:23S rRNA pseudouridine2605 synthase
MERINKLLAHAGVGSRRQCDALIRAGRVAIDGRPVHDLGTKADPEAHKLTVDGNPVGVERPVYWLVNKPRGVVCTNHDPAGRTRAVDLVPHVAQRVYTVGRLDEMSEGLLLLTNDGDLAFQLMHPRFGVEKTYLVQVQGQPSKGDLAQLLQGVWLSDGKVRARRVRQVKRQGESTWLRIVLAEGKNREVRRMLAKQGHKVLTLKREAIGPVQLDRLPKGKARRLSGAELEALRQSARRRPKTSTESEAAGTPPERDRRPPEKLPRRPARPQRTRRP